MTDLDLIAATVKAATNECVATAGLLALLGELDERRLYLGQGCSSLFTYCTQVLHFSEHAAYHRIEAARAARRFPAILSLVADGSVSLTTVTLLRPHLTRENHTTLLDGARHKSKREVEHQIACMAPKVETKSVIRSLTRRVVPDEPLLVCPQGSPVSEEPSGAVDPTLAAATPRMEPRPFVTQLSENTFLVRVSLSAEAHGKLRRAQALLRHTIPTGDPAEIIDRALTVLVAQLERTKLAVTARPRQAPHEPPSAPRHGDSSGSRHIPASVRRAVWRRDNGRCAFKGAQGRCTETGRLEFHHVVPYARGGPADETNISLRCRAHNNFERELLFGEWTSRDNSVRIESRR